MCSLTKSHTRNRGYLLCCIVMVLFLATSCAKRLAQCRAHDNSPIHESCFPWGLRLSLGVGVGSGKAEKWGLFTGSLTPRCIEWAKMLPRGQMLLQWLLQGRIWRHSPKKRVQEMRAWARACSYRRVRKEGKAGESGRAEGG